MRHPRTSTIYDQLRIETSHNGAIKSISPQSEKPIAANSFAAAMESSGVGQASTGGRAHGTYSGGGLTPQIYTRPPMNVDDQLHDAGKAMIARSSNPSRGITPNSPLLRRR
jgi:hypothetical protein